MSDSASSPAIHPLAPEHLPYFIPGADGSDGMFTTMVYLLFIAAFFMIVFYLYLHSLPERMAHGQDRTQLQIVAILTLLALFTHNNAYWVAALLLAALTVPDFLTPVTSAARSLAVLANRAYEGDEREDNPDQNLHHDSGHGAGDAETEGKGASGEDPPGEATAADAPVQERS
ncbi:MAG: hypothetical protein AAGF79_11125 [Pseudomonadota bacterium]